MLLWEAQIGVSVQGKKLFSKEAKGPELGHKQKELWMYIKETFSLLYKYTYKVT